MFAGLQNYYSNYVEANAKAAMEKNTAQADGTSEISFDVGLLNFDVLRRKRAFYTGIDLQLKPEYGESKELLDFSGLPDIVPIKPKTGYVSTDF